MRRSSHHRWRPPRTLDPPGRPGPSRPKPGVAGSLAFLLLVLSGGLHPASSQSVEGVVEDRDSGEPLVAVSVELVDGDGEVRARALTDAGGRFTLEAPAPGRYGLRADRLGARTLEEEPFELEEGGRVVRDLRLDASPVALDALEVTAEPRTPAEEVARRAGTRRDIVAGEELADAQRHGDRIIDVVRRWAGVEVTEGTAAPVTPPPGTVCVELRRRIQGLDPSQESPCEMVLVVMDGVRLAGSAATDVGRTLADLRAADFESVELLNGRQAYQRYGTDGAQGAIVLHSRGSGPYQHPDRDVADRDEVDEGRVSHRRGFLVVLGGLIFLGIR